MSGQILSGIRRIILAVLFAVISFFNFIRIDSVSHSVSDTLRPFIIQTLALILILLLIDRLLGRNKTAVMKK